MTELPSEPWKPDSDVLGLLVSSSRARAAGPMLFLVTGYLYFWITSGHKLWGAALAATQFSVVKGIANYRARVPRQAASGDYDERPLALLAAYMRIPKPRVVIVPEQRSRAQVRGSAREPTLVISSATALLWSRHPRAHAVQACHELAHVWSRDLDKYYFRSSGTIFFAAQLICYGYLVKSPDQALNVSSVVVALIALQSYLRSREHAADFLAAQLIGPPARDELPATESAHGVRLPFFRTHPTAAERRQAFAQPEILFSDLRASMFAFGYLSIVSLNLGTALMRFLFELGRREAFDWAAPIWAIGGGWVLGALLGYGAFISRSDDVRSWLRWLFLGQFASFLVLGHRMDWRLMLIAFLFSWVCAKAWKALSVVPFYFLHPENMSSAAYRIEQGAIGAAAWLATAEFVYHGALVNLALKL